MSSVVMGQLDAYLAVLAWSRKVLLLGMGSTSYETRTLAEIMRAYSRILTKIFDDLMHVTTFDLFKEREKQSIDHFQYPFKQDELSMITENDVKMINDYLKRFLEALEDLTDRSATFCDWDQTAIQKTE